MRDACQKGLTKLNKWLPDYTVRKNIWEQTYIKYIYATILDPRFKMQQFSNWGFDDNQIRRIRRSFQSLFEQ